MKSEHPGKRPEDPFHRPTLSTAVFYRDPARMLDWLGRAFGFRLILRITDQEGNLRHAAMALGEGEIMVGSEWDTWTASPASTSGRNTQSIHVLLGSGLEAHCASARARGARILQEPTDEFWGDRVYRALDPEGHVWTFAENIRRVSREEAERASGLRIEGSWPEP